MQDLLWHSRRHTVLCLPPPQPQCPCFAAASAALSVRLMDMAAQHSCYVMHVPTAELVLAFPCHRLLRLHVCDISRGRNRIAFLSWFIFVPPLQFVLYGMHVVYIMRVAGRRRVEAVLMSCNLHCLFGLPPPPPPLRPHESRRRRECRQRIGG